MLLIAEIGSTTTVVSAFAGLETETPHLLGQGQAPTTAISGDVTVGLQQALRSLQAEIDAPIPDDVPLYASSSAAGGLKMTVHGLVYDMTAKAAKEAALGAGAVVHMVTAGLLKVHDLAKMVSIRPNIIMLAGGVENGESETVLANASLLAKLPFRVPILYAGNSVIRSEIELILTGAGFPVRTVANVYPRIDELQVEPARRAIQALFEEHIVHAPGMEKIRSWVTGPIMPTPGAVMQAARLLAEEMGDLVVIDIGGATTDIHSVAEGSDRYRKLSVYPEPKAKRTVEGDLGLYVNASRVADLIGYERLADEFGMPMQTRVQEIPAIPTKSDEIALAECLATAAAQAALARHAGRLRHLYGPGGRVSLVEGKDLSQVKWLIGTGGALTHLPGRRSILAGLRRSKPGQELWPSPEASTLIDHRYIMATCGLLAPVHPQAALQLMKASFADEEGR